MKVCYCGNTELKKYSSKYFKCEKCNSLVSMYDFDENISVVQEENTDLYGRNYWEKVMVKEANVQSLDELIDMYLSERALYWLKYLLKHANLGSRVAEIGCGLGQFSYLLEKSGFDVTAFELSPGICDYIREQLGLHVVCGELKSENKSYDSIILMDVIEHLLDPESFLKDCAERMQDDGILVLQTPCYDSDLSYNQMTIDKPRFEHLLTERQHVFLFSREAMKALLKKFGFNYVLFEPAYFGDDYDQFLFASKKPISNNSEEQIDSFLNKQKNGRLIKALLSLFEQKEDLKQKYMQADQDRSARGEQVAELTELLKKEEKNWGNNSAQIDTLISQLKESEEDREARMNQVNELTAMLKESETDREARMNQVNELTAMLKESEADREARMSQIDELTAMLKESEADCEARMSQVDELTTMLKESEADREARMNQVNELNAMLKRSEENSLARMSQIEELTRLLKESEEDRAARLVQINTLTDIINQNNSSKEEV